LNSSPLLTFGQVLWKIILLHSHYFWTNQWSADTQSRIQTIYFSMTLLYEKENKKNFFCKQSDALCKKLVRKKFQKTNIRFEFLDPDHPSVNPYRKNSFYIFTSFFDQSVRCGHTSKQAIRQFMFVRLFSTRKRTRVQ